MPGSANASDSLNVEDTASKGLELAADRFVAEQIRTGVKEIFPSTRMLPASSLAMRLSAMSFNLAGSRLIDNFGASATNPASVFWDVSYTHHNTELRILIMNHEVSPTAQSKQLLDAFLLDRETPSDSRQPIIIK
jgi:hypothetical protein